MALSYPGADITDPSTIDAVESIYESRMKYYLTMRVDGDERSVINVLINHRVQNWDLYNVILQNVPEETHVYNIVRKHVSMRGA